MTSTKIQIFNIIWQGIPITITFNPDWQSVYRKYYGYAMTHTVIQRDDGGRFPMTGTGYRSHFMDERHLEGYTDIVAYVIARLIHEAQSKSWKTNLADQNQLKLF